MGPDSLLSGFEILTKESGSLLPDSLLMRLRHFGDRTGCIGIIALDLRQVTGEQLGGEDAYQRG